MHAIAISLVSKATNFVFPMVIIAVAVALVPAPVFSFPSTILEPQNLGLVFGILSTFSSIGIFFGPYVAGLVRDRTNSYEKSFMFLSIVALLITATALVLRIMMRRGRNLRTRPHP